MNLNMLRFMWVMMCLTYYSRSTKIKKIPELEKQIEFWRQDGMEQLKRAYDRKFNKNYARNIVLFIGDGMGVSTVTAARYLKNQRDFNSKLPDVKLKFEQFPNVALIDTSNVDRYVSDSAGTATAIMCGVKTNINMVGVGPNVKYGDCNNYKPAIHDVQSIGDLFHAQGRSVGIVTNTRLTHATPSTLYAHSASRDWEYVTPKKCPKSLKDIARQFIDKSEYFQIALGGGKANFLPTNIGGKRQDNRNLITEWNQKLSGKRVKYINTAEQLANLDVSEYDHVLGLFTNDSMSFEYERPEQEPDLTEMTVAAIKMLRKNEKGFFLLVEAARIDHAHHKSYAQIALNETLKLDEAVSAALKILDMNDTLVTVTADHSHTFTIGSYVDRENDITQINTRYTDMDKKSLTTLLYSNGPGYKSPRQNISVNTKLPMKHQYSSGVPLIKGTHGGEDVAAYSQGPWSHLLQGHQRQNYLGHVMRLASCTIDKNTPGFDNRLLSHCQNGCSIVQFSICILIVNLCSVMMKLI